MRPFRICGMGVSLLHQLQKQTQQHTQDYAERRRQEEGQGRPAETAGFLLDGDEGGAARPVKNDKHHGAQGRLPGPSGSQEQLSRGSGRQLPSQRRSPVMVISSTGITSSLAGSARRKLRSAAPFIPNRSPGGFKKSARCSSRLRPPHPRLLHSQRSRPAGAATATARPATNRVRSRSDRTIT